MQDISDFFSKIAAFFNDGVNKTPGDVVLLPTTIYVGSDVHFIPNLEAFDEFIVDFANRLRAQGVCETTYEIVSQEPLSNNGVRVNIHWKHMDSDGNAVASHEICYFLRAEGDVWKIALIEFASEPGDIVKATIPDA